MISFKLLYRSLLLTLAVSLTACSSSNSESVEDVMDDSSDNQINSPVREPEMIDGEIPSPEIVSAETSAMAASGAAEPAAATGDQSEIDSIIQAEDSAQNQLAQKPESAPAAVAVAPSEQPDSYGMESPSLATVAAEGEGKAVVSKRSAAKSHHSKSKVKTRRANLEGASPIDASGLKAYIVQPGDTLGRISQILYGTSKRWQNLAQVNKLGNSTAIYPGDVLQYSPDEHSASFEAQWEGLPRKTLTVKQHDTLSNIAAQVMGHKHFWKLLWRWNASVVSDPHRIAPGQSISYVAPQDLTSFYTERKKQVLSH